jgi:hypothetical protein
VLWDLDTKKEWARLPPEKVGSGRGMAFSPDGGVLAVACHQMEPWGTGPPGFQFWDVSKRPGARSTSGDFPPPTAEPIAQRDDALERTIQFVIATREGPERSRGVSVEVLGDGTVVLKGRVSSESIKQNIERMIVAEFPIENRYRRTRTPRKVRNEIVADGP